MIEFYKRQCEYFLREAISLQDRAKEFLLKWAEESAVRYMELKPIKEVV